MEEVSVMWFRRDLRLKDNRALDAAFKNSEKVLLVFQVNPDQFIKKSMNHQAFFTSVANLKKEIEKKNMHLQILYGEPKECFEKLKKKVPEWQAVYFNKDECGGGQKRDREMLRFFDDQDIQAHAYMDHHLHGAEEIMTKSETLYKVFTPYYNQWVKKAKPTPSNARNQPKKVVTETLFSDWEEKFEQVVQKISLPFELPVGTEAGERLVKKFIQESIEEYDHDRDYPAKDKTSHLSRFLRTGELSIRMVWAEVEKIKKTKGRQTFMQELAWRDFYNMIYHANPDQKNQPIQANFSFIEWRQSKKDFERWKNGDTGVPIVDAAMRQLKETGWMHNRLRMITASFLTKDLLIDWRWGERYFQQMLIDYDPASNIGGWQWAASTGTDAVPYFRVFNPFTQSQKYDHLGEFIYTYVSELDKVPSKYVHQPEKLPKEKAEEIDFTLDQSYPSPIVDHTKARKRALAAYEHSKEVAQEKK